VQNINNTTQVTPRSSRSKIAKIEIRKDSEKKIKDGFHAASRIHHKNHKMNLSISELSNSKMKKNNDYQELENHKSNYLGFVDKKSLSQEKSNQKDKK
jgi:hypothetical protein